MFRYTKATLLMQRTRSVRTQELQLHHMVHTHSVPSNLYTVRIPCTNSSTFRRMNLHGKKAKRARRLTKVLFTTRKKEKTRNRTPCSIETLRQLHLKSVWSLHAWLDWIDTLTISLRVFSPAQVEKGWEISNSLLSIFSYLRFGASCNRMNEMHWKSSPYAIAQNLVFKQPEFLIF